MNRNLRNPMAAVLERYFASQSDDFALTTLTDRVVESWDLRQMLLTERISARIQELIEGTTFTETEKEELCRVLIELRDLAMADFIAGMRGNPIHHNFQVVENMLRLCIGEDKPYCFVKTAVILACSMISATASSIEV